MEFEKATRLSESLLWKLQNDAYSEFGIEAWSRQGVPSYITSNPFIARCYAHVVLGYIRDLIAQGTLVANEPIYLFDLGAGTGRFGFLFLKELLSFLPNINVCYVMTDIVQANLDFCRHHPLLQTYIQKGVLDFAYYHHQFESEPLHLMVSQRTLTHMLNPIVLIANYFFDTIPQDLFRVRDGVLEEGRVALSAENWEEGVKPEAINHLRWQWSYYPIEHAKDYYAHFPKANALLNMYQKLFEGIAFLFPIGGMHSLRYFAKLSQNRLLLLAGDQGVSTEEQVKAWGEPKLSLHGSFSISVSYHALALFFRELGGLSLLTSDPDPLFVVMGGILGGSSPEATHAFKEYLDAFDPTDYWKLVSSMMDNPANSLDQILLMLKFGNWDPMNMHAFFERIRELLPKATEGQRKWISIAIERVWDNFYPISKDAASFVLNLGVLLYDLGLYSDALKYFERALVIDSEVPHARQNILLCLKHL